MSERHFSGKTVCLLLNGLSERTPFMHTVTLPSNSSLLSSLKDECICFYVKPELHDIGVIEKRTTFGNTVRCYNLERTICDFLRLLWSSIFVTPPSNYPKPYLFSNGVI